MKGLLKAAVLIALLAVGAMVGVAFLLNAPRVRAEKRIKDADPAALLAACRSVLRAQSTFTSEEPTPSWQDEHITIKKNSHQYVNGMPAEIQAVEPNAVLIFSNQVALFYYASPIRYVIRAFETNAIQYGTQRIIDGLWEASNLDEKEEERKDLSGQPAR